MRRLSNWIQAHPVLFWGGLVALIAILLRLVLWLTYPPVTYSDTAAYRKLADDILNGLKNYDGTRTPGYPAFMALFGSDQVVYAVQLVLGFLISMGFFYIGWKMTGRPVLGAVLGLAHTLNLGQLFFEADLITETVTTFWLCLALLGVFIWLKSANRRSLFWPVLIGITTGLATLTRPLYIYMPFWLALWLGVSWSKRRLHISWRPVLGIVIPAVLIIGGWVGENYNAHRIFGLSTMTGYHLIEHTGYFFEYVPDEYAAIRDTFIRYRDARIARIGNPGNVIFEAIPEMMKVSGLTFYDLSILLEKISFDLIIHHPDLYMRTVIKGWWLFWYAPVYWKAAGIPLPFMANFLQGFILVERFCLAGSNMVFLVTSVLALTWKKVRQIWKLDSFLWLLATTIWITSVMQTLPDHGDNPRFLVPMQTLVVIWVLWLFYQTYQWYQLRRQAAVPGGGEG